jgi:serpin B
VTVHKPERRPRVHGHWYRPTMHARCVVLGSLFLATCKAQPASSSAIGSTPPSAPTVVSSAPSSPSPIPFPKTPAPPSPGDPAALDAVTRGDRDFAWRLYARVRGREGNLSLSPTSIRLALAMAYAGAGGDTKSQMGRVLALDDTASSGFAALLADWSARSVPRPVRVSQEWARELAERRPLILHVVNRLWGQLGKAFRPDFLGLLRDDFGAPLAQLDFHGAPEPSRQTINAWVAKETEEEINNLLAPGAIVPDTRMVLTNAMYFKAFWTSAFSPRATASDDFTTAPGKKVRAPMMRAEGYFRLAKFAADGTSCAALELRYAADGVAAIILLPDAKDGLSELEASIHGAFLDEALSQLKDVRVNVTLPRFRITSSLSLGEPLSAMGMPDAFAPQKADFSAMDGTRELFLGAVTHKAFVAVDEDGTEAAAATAARAIGAAAAPPPVPFRADHPFLFLIVDAAHHTVLFMGRVVAPTA